jgi:hypothetical protein
MKPHDTLIGLVIVTLFGAATMARAGDHAFHIRKDGVTVNWSLHDEGGGRVWAYGTVETTGQPVEVTLELVALDAAGNVVARDREVVPLGIERSTPPVLALRVPRDPRTRRYELRVVDSASLEWIRQR